MYVLLETLDGKALLLVKGLNSMNGDVLDLMMATFKRHFGNTSLLNRTLRARLEVKAEIKWGSIPIAQHVAKAQETALILKQRVKPVDNNTEFLLLAISKLPSSIRQQLQCQTLATF